MVYLSQPVKVIIFGLLVVIGCCGIASAQDALQVMELVPLRPDSIYVRRDGGNVTIGWYPAPDSLSAVVGSRDFNNWYVNHSPQDRVEVSFSGAYTGDIDRTITFQKTDLDRVVVGVDTTIELNIVTDDPFETYTAEINIGTNYYTPGEMLPIVLVGEEGGEILDVGVSVAFSAGIVDTAFGGIDAAYFEIDLQDFEGFHIWRGLDPFPSSMVVITEISKEDAFKGVDWDSIYFEEWPMVDAQGRQYYEWTDENVFVGFTYYYHVTTYDRGYFKGFFKYNKKDNFICHDLCGDICNDIPDDEICDCDTTVFCRPFAQEITMSVDIGTDFNAIYAVPNPFRTGTSAETSPFYDNFPGNVIKFYNVPLNATIKIYTVAGDLIWVGSQGGEEESGVVSWDTKNQRGQEVSSGLYIFRSEGQNGEDVYGRIIVIR
ncbi:MAG: hypothetical protein JSV33_04850 [bacterium]|nr:MAG: hypothetical protein JSV33_04850 [bacterium]